MSVSGWRQMAARIVPGGRPAPLPAITMTMLGATIVAAMRDRNSHVERGLADLHLALDIRGHGLLDFEALPAIAQAGYAASLPEISRWLGIHREPR